MNFRDFLIKELINAHIPSPRLEADIILKNTVPNYPEISDSEKTVALSYLKRRLSHEPIDKIIGKKDFYKYQFKVNSDVLSPRPDTEILVEKAISIIKDKSVKVLDLGTGSGCIVLSILKDCPNAFGVGVDISAKALKVAKENAELLKVGDRIEFINTSFEKTDNIDDKFDIIVSNPPYIPLSEIDELDEEVKNYDPIEALVGGEDGFVFYEQIAKVAPLLLKDDGYILLEGGYNQAYKIADIFIAHGFEVVEIIKDLAQINRCVLLKK